MEVKPDSKKFKILQLSNSVWTPSGYGVQSKGTLYEWNKYYDVRQLAFYGLEGAALSFNGLQIYPSLPGDEHGDRTARLIFRNSPWKPDLFVTLYDIWMGAYVDPSNNTPQGFQPIHPHWIPICVTGDTEIIVDDWNVFSYDGASYVKQVYDLPPYSPILKIITESGKTLKITADNPVMTKTGWKQAKQLYEGDMVYCLAEESIREGHRMGISRWINRWRRKHLSDWVSEEVETQRNKINAKNKYLKYRHQNDRLGGDQSQSDYALLETFLETKTNWLSQSEIREILQNFTPNSMGRIQSSENGVGKCSSLSSFKKTSRTDNLEIHRTTTESDKEVQFKSEQRGLGIGTGTAKFEWEKITERTEFTESVNRVYDLQTLSHAFFANGILIHNCMVDHEPIPEATLIQAAVAYRVVTPTLFGVEQFRKYDVDAWRIPFGVNTEAYVPPKNKKECKTWLNDRSVVFDVNNNTRITEDSFVIVMNGANKDPYRKAFMRMFSAIQIFLSNNPDAQKNLRVYVHSWMKQARDIPHGAKTLHVQQLCRGTDDYHNLRSVPESAMAKIYGAADVFMHLSEGGGFEVPILEALSCGVPVIGSDFVGMNELVEGHGWSIPMKTKYFSQLDALQGIADEYKAADALTDAYNHPEKREKFGKAGREFALDYDFKHINAKWIEFFEDIRGEWAYTPLETRLL